MVPSGGRGPDVAHGARLRAAPVGEAAALLLQVGKAQDGVDEIVVGSELERVDAGARQALAQLALAPFGGGPEALAKAGVVGVDEDMLAGLGVSL